MSRERVGGQRIGGAATALLPLESTGTGLRRERRASRLERGAMEAATDSTRFGYILELLKRDKVGTEPPRSAGRAGSARGERRLPSQALCRVF